MKKYNLGDIVRLKLLGDAHYYIITDVADFTQVGDEKMDVDYEIVLIYPVQRVPVTENIFHDELELVTEYESKDYDILIDYVLRERVRLGHGMTLPQNMRHVILGEKKVSDEVEIKQVKKPVVKKKATRQKFGFKEIEEILNDDTIDKKIDSYVDKMNEGLDLLNEAIEKDNKGQIEAIKKELEKIRQTLMELEYFPLTLQHKHR